MIVTIIISGVFSTREGTIGITVLIVLIVVILVVVPLLLVAWTYYCTKKKRSINVDKITNELGEGGIPQYTMLNDAKHTELITVSTFHNSCGDEILVRLARMTVIKGQSL